MSFIARSPYIETWFFAGIMLQILLLGLVNFRISGPWLSALFQVRASTQANIRPPMGIFRGLLLFCNALIGLTLFFSYYFQADFFLKSALVLALSLSILLAIIWHLDYLVFWILVGKFPIIELQQGNVAWVTLGIGLLAMNSVGLFMNPSLFLWWATLGFSLVLLLVRIIWMGFAMQKHGFSWYYFILYFCSVYVIPSVLISKYYESQWLEFLTP